LPNEILKVIKNVDKYCLIITASPRKDRLKNYSTVQLLNLLLTLDLEWSEERLI